MSEHLPGTDLRTLPRGDLLKIYRTFSDPRSKIAAVVLWMRKDRKDGNHAAADAADAKIDRMLFPES